MVRDEEERLLRFGCKSSKCWSLPALERDFCSFPRDKRDCREVRGTINKVKVQQHGIHVSSRLSSNCKH